MSANVETMCYVRDVPWHGLGTRVEEAPISADAIRLAGLDWNVEARDVKTNDGNGNEIIIPNCKANVRTSDDKVLGLVTDRYKIVQNQEAFDFTDALIGEGCTYETAGSLAGGKKVFLLARMPQQKILGEEYDPFICFTNTHDGSGSIRACCTNVRVVCQNTLNLALSTASRMWAVRHTGKLETKLSAAQRTLNLANKYNDEFSKFAEKAANISISREDQLKLLDELFPVHDDMSDRMKNNAMKNREGFEECMVAVDLRPFYGTLWGFLNAASDFTYHGTPNRVTSGLQENRMKKCIDGAPIFDRILEMCPVAA